MTLTLSSLREKGFRDKRWTAEDKRDQLHDVIKLHNRDKKHTDKKVAELRKRQIGEMRNLSREVQEYRGLLDSAKTGDKQMLRNTLRRHRPTQLAYMDHTFAAAIEHVEQSNFTLSKELNQLICLTKQRASQLMALEGEVLNLKRDQQSRGPLLIRNADEQELTSQITNCVVKQNAAFSVNHTYQKIIAILRKDKVYFDALLGALHDDQVTQCKCVVRATQLGQAAAEDVARLQEEAKIVEAELKNNMLERASAVKALRVVVEHNKGISRTHIRAESTSDLTAVKGDDGPAPLLKDLDNMESLMQKMQATTLVSSYLDVFPRFKEQLRQRQRLARQVERREYARDEVLARRNHAQLILHDLKHTMSETEEEAEREEVELRDKMVAEKVRRDGALDDRQKLCTQMVSIRTALCSLMNVLQQVKPTMTMAKSVQEKYSWEIDQERIDELYFPDTPPEANAMALLKYVFAKVSVLVKQLQAEDKAKGLEMPPYPRPFFPDVMAAKREIDRTDEEIGALVLDSYDAVGDVKVPTRASIKAESAKVIRMARKQSEPESYDRIKRVRKEEKWV